MRGKLFDIKRFAVHDGPGIRTTAFLKGCPLNCSWCHNPEGLSGSAKLGYLPLSCIGCGDCVSGCPADAISIRDDAVGAVILDRHNCTCCLKCVTACPTGALMTKDFKLTPSELIKEFSKDEVFFKSSNGGITLSGGDPLFQPEFSAEVLRLAKGREYHTALETCLHTTADILDFLIDLPDLWIIDLKIFDDSKHKKLTGQTNKLILHNYEHLVKTGQSILTRIPIIPGCTDSKGNLVSLGQYIANINPYGTVEPIFYNPLAESKYKNYDMDYPLRGAPPYSDDEKETICAIIAATGAKI